MIATDATESNKTVIRRFYDELWNQWNLATADEIVAPDVSFRGSLGRASPGSTPSKRM